MNKFRLERENASAAKKIIQKMNGAATTTKKKQPTVHQLALKITRGGAGEMERICEFESMSDGYEVLYILSYYKLGL